jgi:hypothetical protein
VSTHTSICPVVNIPKVLPLSINAFKSKLSDSGISEEDYSHAQLAWDTFNIKSTQQYHDLYPMTDVLLLADVAEHFRSVSVDNNGLDAAHYYTATELTFSACLKFTSAKLGLFIEPDQLLFIEKGSAAKYLPSRTAMQRRTILICHRMTPQSRRATSPTTIPTIFTGGL